MSWRCYRRLAAILVCSVAGCEAEPPAVPTTTAPQGPRTEADSRNSVDAHLATDRAASAESSGNATLASKLRFEQVRADSGFAFERTDDIRGLHRIIEANGGGVAISDFDRDGWLDLFLTNGCRIPVATTDPATPSALFRSLAAVAFRSSADRASWNPRGYSHGVATGDYDADGFDDLYVTALGPNSLWHNNGDGTFSDSTSQTGTGVTAWSSTAAFGDVNRDGHLDLYVTNYLEESVDSPRLCRHPDSPDGYVQCSPALFEGVDDVLFLGDGAGSFVDVTREAGIAGLRGKGLGVLIANLDEDPDPEIFVTNDGEANFLLDPAPLERERSTPRSLTAVPHYRERAMASGVGLNEAGFAQANMGIAAGDFDGNGTTDLVITTFYNDTDTLYSNLGGLQFEDATRRVRLTVSTRSTLGFGALFFDADNDGWLELAITNGHVDDRTWMKTGEPCAMPPLLYYNRGGGALESVGAGAGPYFQSAWVGRGLATGDLDRDGRLDLAVSHQRSPSALLLNRSEAGEAVHVRLIGRQTNRNGWGVSVAATCDGDEASLSRTATLSRELYSGGSFQSSSEPVVSLGLGAHQSVRIRTTWLSGDRMDEGVAPGRFALIEGGGIFRLP